MFVSKRRKEIEKCLSEKYGNIGIPAMNIVPAIQLMKELPKVKFDESIDISIVLGIDPKRSEQGIRGFSIIPHGNRKNRKLLVFAKGKHADSVVELGADFVGFEDMIEKIKKEGVFFDVAIAHSECMSSVGQLGKILGTKGVMPNPKMGTVGSDVASIVKDFKSTRHVLYRNDDSGIVHIPVGRMSMDASDIQENVSFLLNDIVRYKHNTVKGKFILRAFISSSMGIGIRILIDQ